jgi:Neocarzinostatin family
VVVIFVALMAVAGRAAATPTTDPAPTTTDPSTITTDPTAPTTDPTTSTDVPTTSSSQPAHEATPQAASVPTGDGSRPASDANWDAVSPSSVTATAALASDPYVLTVTPNTGLTKGQSVTVNVTGASPNEPLFVFECNRPDPPEKTAPPPNALDYCVFASGTYLDQVRADASGNLTAAFRVLQGTYQSLGREVTIGDTAYLFVSDATDTFADVPPTAHAQISFGGGGAATSTTGGQEGGQTEASTTGGQGGGQTGSSTPRGRGAGDTTAAESTTLANTGASTGLMSLAGLVAIVVGAAFRFAAYRRLRRHARQSFAP